MVRRILIGIAGGSGSGKTLVARTIVRELGSDRVVVIDQDSYYRNLEDVPHNDRDARNFDHPDAFDNELLKAHVRDLLAGRSIEEPIYDYNEHRRLRETRTVGEHLVIVLEGILIFVDPELRALMDIKLFIDADPDVRFIPGCGATWWSAADRWTASSASTRRACARCTCSSSSRRSATPT